MSEKKIYKVPVTVSRLETTFVVVQLAACSLCDAEAEAKAEVNRVILDGEFYDYKPRESDWLTEEYDVVGIEQVNPEPYDVDIDLASGSI